MSISQKSSIVLLGLLVNLGGAAPAFAYFGPGGAASGLGAAVALVVAIIAAVFGFVWYPVKRLIRSFRKPDTEQIPTAISTGEPTGDQQPIGDRPAQ